MYLLCMIYREDDELLEAVYQYDTLEDADNDFMEKAADGNFLEINLKICNNKFKTYISEDRYE